MGEINQKANLISSGFEIIQYLSFMSFIQRINSLYFQNNLIFDNDIREIISYIFILIFYFYRNLAFYVQAILTKLNH